ncbi:hypothetical protein EON63_12980 [archaeon]|nr:MAG: hypothetical protein EON63_12980 [archaeon]
MHQSLDALALLTRLGTEKSYRACECANGCETICAWVCVCMCVISVCACVCRVCVCMFMCMWMEYEL